MKLPVKLRDIPKRSTSKESTEKRSGRYLKSMFSEVDGFGDTHWVVGCYIDIDYQRLLRTMSEDELIAACLDQLNKVPPREKFQRKPTASPYGSLELLSYKLREINEQPFIEMMLITDDQKNENFWGEGISFANYKKTRRRDSKN